MGNQEEKMSSFQAEEEWYKESEVRCSGISSSMLDPASLARALISSPF